VFALPGLTCGLKPPPRCLQPFALPGLTCGLKPSPRCLQLFALPGLTCGRGRELQTQHLRVVSFDLLQLVQELQPEDPEQRHSERSAGLLPYPCVCVCVCVCVRERARVSP